MSTQLGRGEREAPAHNATDYSRPVYTGELRINRYQEVPFIVIKKHRQFHVGAGGVTAILVFTRRVVEDIALPTAAMGRNTCANQRPHLVLR